MIQKLRFTMAWAQSLIAVPIVLLHEVTHMAACIAFGADLYELFLLLNEENEGIRCWGVWHEKVGGVAEIIISLSPLIWIPIGWLLMDVSLLVGLFVFLIGFSGVGDIFHVLHYTGIFTVPIPGLDFDELDELHDDRITVFEFSGRST